jgi:hypothetical protein
MTVGEDKAKTSAAILTVGVVITWILGLIMIIHGRDALSLDTCILHYSHLGNMDSSYKITGSGKDCGVYFHVYATDCTGSLADPGEEDVEKSTELGYGTFNTSQGDSVRYMNATVMYPSKPQWLNTKTCDQINAFVAARNGQAQIGYVEHTAYYSSSRGRVHTAYVGGADNYNSWLGVFIFDTIVITLVLGCFCWFMICDSSSQTSTTGAQPVATVDIFAPVGYRVPAEPSIAFVNEPQSVDNSRLQVLEPRDFESRIVLPANNVSV